MVGRIATAADPTTADCLAASDASLKAGNQHKLRAERTHLLTCAADNCPADIRKECVARVDEVNAQIPTVIFSARNAAGADLSAVEITMDGEDILAERLLTAISIDPGEHTFTFATAGEASLTKKLVIQQVEGSTRGYLRGRMRSRLVRQAHVPPIHRMESTRHAESARRKLWRSSRRASACWGWASGRRSGSWRCPEG